MIRRTGVKLVALLAVPALLLAACGDDGDDPDEGGTSAAESSDASETSDTSTGESSSPDPADLAIAEAALLKLSDFPVGWEAVPAEEDEDDVAGEKKIAECAGVDYEDLYDDSNAEAKSPDFTNEDDEEVAVTVTVNETEADTAKAFAIAARPKYRECVAEVAGESMETAFAEAEDEGAEIGEVTINEVSLGSYGDETIAFRITVPIAMDGFNLETTLDAALVRVGRALTYVSGTRFNVGSLTTDEIAGYVELATQRLQTALASAP